MSGGKSGDNDGCGYFLTIEMRRVVVELRCVFDHYWAHDILSSACSYVCNTHCVRVPIGKSIYGRQVRCRPTRGVSALPRGRVVMRSAEKATA